MESKLRRGSWWHLGKIILLYSTLAWLSYLMLLITLQYLPIREEAAFLQLKQDYLGVLHWKIAFFAHVFSSMFALAAGFTQFSPGLLRRWPHLHRAVGRMYVGVICLITGPSGLIMACYANGGVTSRVAFTILAVLWWIFTFWAYRTARQRKWLDHRDFMIRSYALTVSALTLRSWKYLIILFWHPAPMDAYRIVAWLGFVPNLLVAESVIWQMRRSKRRHRQKAVLSEMTVS